MMVLPSALPYNNNDQMIKQTTTTSIRKPLVLLAGNASSLALLNTNKCTRKAFSTTVTPTISASWDLYHLALRELSKMDSQAKLPARRWMAIHRLTLLGHGCANGESWFKIGMVAKCGWIFVAELSVPSSAANSIDANQSQTNTILASLLHTCLMFLFQVNIRFYIS